MHRLGTNPLHSDELTRKCRNNLKGWTQLQPFLGAGHDPNCTLYSAAMKLAGELSIHSVDVNKSTYGPKKRPVIRTGT